MRRILGITLSLVLTAGLVQATAPPVAASTGPSITPQTTASVAVSKQSMDPRAVDPASARALVGDQTAGPAQPGGGSAQATSLAPSATWNVSAQSGGFTWSYPLAVPPAPGDLVPKLDLAYNSQLVDGHTSVTNNQPSWVGDGWDLSAGYVERVYGSCADTTGSTAKKTGDLCWKSDNATVSFPGGTGPLIHDTATGTWRAKQDNAARIEHLTGANNGADGGEYWKITTADGTQYLFGSRADSQATWTVPVFGRNTGEPCHGATWDTSWCTQAWRWNLDQVIDRHGNAMVYTYNPEQGTYGFNLKDTPVGYTRGGTLARIDYGLHDGLDGGSPTGRVLFATADRCVPGSACDSAHPANWPDVPWDAQCGTSCKDHYWPTFWSTKRLDKVTTQVRRGTDFTDVDSWTLNQTFPDPGDGRAALWLHGITHTGLVGGSLALPAVTFEGTQFPNRITANNDGYTPLTRYRVTAIVSEAGGVTSIGYAAPDCTPTTLPTPETNTTRCFPVHWAAPNSPARTDFFAQYVVDHIVTTDRIASSAEQYVRYEYLDGAAWHFDTSEFGKPEDKTWNEYRGYARVRIHTGSAGDSSGPITMTEQRFYRGMNGDHLPNGGVRTVQVTDSQGGARDDDDWLTGQPVEQATFAGETGPVTVKTLSWPAVQGPTATRGDLKAYLVRTATSKTLTAVGTGWRTAQTDTVYDDAGLPTRVNDAADGTPTRCTRTSYVRNTDAWILDLPSRVETVATDCESAPAYPDQALSDVRSSYDGQPFGAAPTKGDATRQEDLDAHPAGGDPVYATKGTVAYDDYGRTTSSTDAAGQTTTTEYTPATGGPATGTVVTDPAGFATTSVLDPAWGSTLAETDANGRRTETAYDALGRVTEVWQPNRDRATQSGTAKFSYLIRNDAPSAVTASRIGPNGDYVSTVTLYDGLYRERQVQAPAGGGGRLITDTRYDTHGRTSKKTEPYFNDAAVDTDLWLAADTDIPAATVTAYDGAGRVVTSTLMSGATEKWHTSTSYDGDRVTVTPPLGGIATTTISDARGQTTQLLQYHGGTPTGVFDATTTTYTPAGKPKSITDAAGNVWKYTYDLHGRQITADDPDKGVVRTTYDAADRVATTTDARGTTLAYSYDALGRKTAEFLGAVGGTKLADWTYDTVPYGKGQPATATRYVGDNAYVSKVLGYNKAYQPVAGEIDIPSGEGNLAGTYVSGASYDPDGTLNTESFPAAGGLFDETVTHTYDDLGHALLTFGGPAGSTVDYATDTQYTRHGEQSRLQLGDPGRRTWVTTTFDEATRRPVRSVVDAEVAAPMQADVRYSYNAAGTITSITDTPIGRPADTQCFGYDYLQRLTEAWTPSGDCSAAPAADSLGGPAPYWQSYSYDLAGNRITDTQHAPTGDTSRTYAYPAPGSARPHAVTSVGTVGQTSAAAYGYDQAGNTIARPGPTGQAQRLTWDAEGRLATVADTTGSSDNVYAPDGSLLIRHDPTGATLYLSGQELRLDNASGQVTGTRYYSHGGRQIAVRDAGGLSWLASDHQGTAQIAVNSATMAVTHRRQLPFGAPRGDAVAFPGQKGFVGGTLDLATGLTRIGARDYDPGLGRFLSVDPVLDPHDPLTLNAYAYSADNPVTKADPTGLWWSWLEKTASAVKNAVTATAKAVANAYDGFSDWVYENRGAIALVAGVAGIVLTGGIGAAIGTAAVGIGWGLTGLSVGLTAVDAGVALHNGDGWTAGVDALSLATGGVAAGLDEAASTSVRALRAANASNLGSAAAGAWGVKDPKTKSVCNHADTWQIPCAPKDFGDKAGNECQILLCGVYRPKPPVILPFLDLRGTRNPRYVGPVLPWSVVHWGGLPPHPSPAANNTPPVRPVINDPCVNVSGTRIRMC